MAIRKLGKKHYIYLYDPYTKRPCYTGSGFYNKKEAIIMEKLYKKMISGIARPYHKHGMRYTLIYSKWIHLKNACYNPNNSRYVHYGEQGITMCSQWADDFSQFCKDMGNPTGKYLTVMDKRPGTVLGKNNCKWSDIKGPKESKNKRRL